MATPFPDKREHVPPTQATPPSPEEALPQEAPAWVKQYSALSSKLPSAVSSRLPSSVAAEAGVNIAAERLSTLSNAGKGKYDELSAVSKVKYGELRRTGSQRAGELQTFTKETWKARGPESLATQAWSVTKCVLLFRLRLSLPFSPVSCCAYSILRLVARLKLLSTSA
jgi:hypothetical protein